MQLPGRFLPPRCTHSHDAPPPTVHLHSCPRSAVGSSGSSITLRPQRPTSSFRKSLVWMVGIRSRFAPSPALAHTCHPLSPCPKFQLCPLPTCPRTCCTFLVVWRPAGTDCLSLIPSGRSLPLFQLQRAAAPTLALQPRAESKPWNWGQPMPEIDPAPSKRGILSRHPTRIFFPAGLRLGVVAWR